MATLFFNLASLAMKWSAAISWLEPVTEASESFSLSSSLSVCWRTSVRPSVRLFVCLSTCLCVCPYARRKLPWSGLSKKKKEKTVFPFLLEAPHHRRVVGFAAPSCCCCCCRASTRCCCPLNSFSHATETLVFLSPNRNRVRFRKLT